MGHRRRGFLEISFVPGDRFSPFPESGPKTCRKTKRSVPGTTVAYRVLSAVILNFHFAARGERRVVACQITAQATTTNVWLIGRVDRVTAQVPPAASSRALTMTVNSRRPFRRSCPAFSIEMILVRVGIVAIAV